MQTVEWQTFDRVHDTQFVYRQLLRAMAAPGEIAKLEPLLGKLGLEDPLAEIIALLAMTLLDGEVSFALLPADERSERLASFIRMHTFGKQRSIEEAGYVFAHGADCSGGIDRTMQALRVGTLLQPEDGATLFLAVERLEANQDADEGWRLSGPGIAASRKIVIHGLPDEWIEARNRLNAEYPKGIDLVLFTPEGELVALPRTTRMTDMKNGGLQQWHT